MIWNIFCSESSLAMPERVGRQGKNEGLQDNQNIV
jgi:hypothetical protein